jgi:tRNA(adenine34) deaminase
LSDAASQVDVEDRRWMELALAEAEAAYAEGETPVGAVVVSEGRLLGRGHNRVEALPDPTAHAEILALGAAAEALGSWRLEGCTLYTTLEPCAMCAGAAVLARVREIVYAAADPKRGACGSVLLVAGHPGLHHLPLVRGGLLAERAGELLRSFFASLRENAAEAGESG